MESETELTQIEEEKPKKSPTDIKYIIPFISKLDCFKRIQQFRNVNLSLIAQCMKYDYVEKGKDVFQIDSEGNAMFIILKGRIRVLIRSQIAETLKLDNVSNLESMIEVKQQGNGSLFGELALLNRKARAATINCIDDTHLAVINKKDFERILRASHENHINSLASFFKEIPLFSLWGKVGLSKLVHNFEEVHCKKGEYIFKEGENAEYVYVVINGEFEV